MANKAVDVPKPPLHNHCDSTVLSCITTSSPAADLGPVYTYKDISGKIDIFP